MKRNKWHQLTLATVATIAAMATVSTIGAEESSSQASQQSQPSTTQVSPSDSSTSPTSSTAVPIESSSTTESSTVAASEAPSDTDEATIPASREAANATVRLYTYSFGYTDVPTDTVQNTNGSTKAGYYKISDTLYVEVVHGAYLDPVKNVYSTVNPNDIFYITSDEVPSDSPAGRYITSYLRNDQSGMNYWGAGLKASLLPILRGYADGTYIYDKGFNAFFPKDQFARNSDGTYTPKEILISKGLPVPSEKKEVYRLYHNGLKVHLYTTSVKERNVLRERGWQYEGVSWKTETEGGTPVYRLYHPGIKYHFYTKDANEYKVLGKRGWKQEGIAYRSSGTVAIYRLYNPGLQKHLFTKDANEYKVLAQRGWKQEGIAWYGQP